MNVRMKVNRFIQDVVHILKVDVGSVTITRMLTFRF